MVSEDRYVINGMFSIVNFPRRIIYTYFIAIPVFTLIIFDQDGFSNFLRSFISVMGHFPSSNWDAFRCFLHHLFDLVEAAGSLRKYFLIVPLMLKFPLF